MTEIEATNIISDAFRTASDELLTNEVWTILVRENGVMAHPARDNIQAARDALDRALAAYDAATWTDAPSDLRPYRRRD